MYNVIDINNTIVTENISEAQAIEFVNSNSAESEFVYFFYPIDETTLVEIKESVPNLQQEVRFIKRIEE